MCEVNCSITYRLKLSTLERSAFASSRKELDYQIKFDDDISENVIDKQILIAGIAEIQEVEGADTLFEILDLRSSVVETLIPSF